MRNFKIWLMLFVLGGGVTNLIFPTTKIGFQTSMSLIRSTASATGLNIEFLPSKQSIAVNGFNQDYNGTTWYPVPAQSTGFNIYYHSQSVGTYTFTSSDLSKTSLLFNLSIQKPGTISCQDNASSQQGHYGVPIEFIPQTPYTILQELSPYYQVGWITIEIQWNTIVQRLGGNQQDNPYIFVSSNDGMYQGTFNLATDRGHQIILWTSSDPILNITPIQPPQPIVNGSTIKMNGALLTSINAGGSSFNSAQISIMQNMIKNNQSINLSVQKQNDAFYLTYSLNNVVQFLPLPWTPWETTHSPINVIINNNPKIKITLTSPTQSFMITP